MDFSCVSEIICVELDGQDHFTDEGMERDEKRDAFLKQFGIQILRFENNGVWNNPQAILDEIRNHFNKVDGRRKFTPGEIDNLL